MKTKLLPVILTVLFGFLCVNSVFCEELTITTYYPSPYGSYKELRAQRMGIGDNYSNTSSYCWDGTCTQTVGSDADLVIEGNLGVSTVTPTEKLDISEGNIRLSDGYSIGFGSSSTDTFISGSTASHALAFYTNSNARMAINSSGYVGIGTASPAAALHVAGEARITGVSSDGTGKIVCIKSDGNLGTCAASSITTSGCTCD